jgi:hypothetical protein
MSCLHTTIDSSDDEEGDAEHANKVLDEDWDTSSWTPPEIEAACETLINVSSSCSHTGRRESPLTRLVLQECEDSDNLKRTVQAKRMLLRLLTRHKVAVEYVETSLETLVLKGMRTAGKKQDFDPTVTFRVADLLASVSECLADKMSRLMAVTKVIRCLVHEMDAGVRLCQHFWRMHHGKEALDKLPKRIRFRQQYMLNLKSADLRDAWRAVQKSSADIPMEVTVSYLR